MALPSNTKRKIFDGRYEIISIVGRGAESVVYHARHISGANQEVALKVLVNRKGQLSLTERLRKEALTLVSCRHRFVVRLDDFHSIDDLCYLSMEYAPLGDLSKYTSALESRKLPTERALAFLKQTLEAVEFVHATGVLHRDLRPENILVVNDNDIRLADFGLALLPGDDVDPQDLKNGVGSLDYLAPEVLQGIRYDNRSDLYSVGVSFYELMTGKHPFADAPLADQLEVRRDTHLKPLREIAGDIPANVASVVMKLLSFDANARFQSAAEALAALDAKIEDGLPQPAPSTEITSYTSFDADTDEVSSLTDEVPPAQTHPAASSSIGFDTPANTDTPPAQQPTEKIDLERIKSIIAQDSSRRFKQAANDTTVDEEVTATPLDDGAQERAFGLAPKPKPAERSTPTTTTPRPPAQRSLRSRVLVVFGTCAALTVALLLVLPLIAPVDSPTNAPATAVESTEQAPPPAAEPTLPTPSGPFMELLQEGTYTGTLDGLVAGNRVPMMLLASPSERKLVLFVGVDGWLPVETSMVAEDGSLITSPTFRSNGVILKFKGELSSGEIIGTFTDMVSGETGVWNVKQAS